MVSLHDVVSKFAQSRVPDTPEYRPHPHRLMRRTGKLYGLTLTASFLSIFASLLASTWNQNTPDFRFWADLLFQGLGLDGYTANERENANQCLADENDV